MLVYLTFMSSLKQLRIPVKMIILFFNDGGVLADWDSDFILSIVLLGKEKTKRSPHFSAGTPTPYMLCHEREREVGLILICFRTSLRRTHLHPYRRHAVLPVAAFINKVLQ